MEHFCTFSLAVLAFCAALVNANQSMIKAKNLLFTGRSDGVSPFTFQDQQPAPEQIQKKSVPFEVTYVQAPHDASPKSAGNGSGRFFPTDRSSYGSVGSEDPRDLQAQGALPPVIHSKGVGAPEASYKHIFDMEQTSVFSKKTEHLGKLQQEVVKEIVVLVEEVDGAARQMLEKVYKVLCKEESASKMIGEVEVVVEIVHFLAAVNDLIEEGKAAAKAWKDFEKAVQDFNEASQTKGTGKETLVKMLLSFIEKQLITTLKTESMKFALQTVGTLLKKEIIKLALKDAYSDAVEKVEKIFVHLKALEAKNVFNYQ